VKQPKSVKDEMRECINETCGWRGKTENTCHPKHNPEDKLCPECYEVTELITPISKKERKPHR
jgi:hypothetical protein